MFKRFTSLVLVVLVSSPAFADPPKKADPTADILAKLREPWKAPDLSTGRMQDLIDALRDKYGVAVIVREEAFDGNGIDNFRDRTVKFPTGKGLGLRTVLRTVLAQVSGTFLVRKDHLEFLPDTLAARVTGAKVDTEEFPRVMQPLVSVIVKEKPLNDVAADIAEEFDLNVVVAPQAGDSRMAFVTLRLLNVPADKALDTLATAADLRVVRKGNVLLLTSPDHATALANEKNDRERLKIELEKLREAPANLPAPVVAPPPVPKTEEKK